MSEEEIDDSDVLTSKTSSGHTNVNTLIDLFLCQILDVLLILQKILDCVVLPFVRGVINRRIFGEFFRILVLVQIVSVFLQQLEKIDFSILEEIDVNVSIDGQSKLQFEEMSQDFFGNQIPRPDTRTS